MPERFAAPLFALLFAAFALLLAACAGADAPAGPVGHGWTLTGIEGAPVAAPGRSTLRVAEDGKVSGDAGCNRYAGQAEVSEEAITFGPLLATKRACEPAVMRQEARLFENLRSVARWRIEAGELALLDAAGRPLLRFSPQP